MTKQLKPLRRSLLLCGAVALTLVAGCKIGTTVQTVEPISNGADTDFVFSRKVTAQFKWIYHTHCNQQAQCTADSIDAFYEWNWINDGIQIALHYGADPGWPGGGNYYSVLSGLTSNVDCLEYRRFGGHGWNHFRKAPASRCFTGLGTDP